ncbi:Hypothetical protein R9X50_00233800 [Acrodontium crateriforme]|uniref:LDB19 N-terminal domain-containing protein n=1 Tax=Acrodontium crateriforme TaxID=150365 RepID=A0AAQ3M0T2_9PEZI|nr:Hypothetical protein R9X50_00233800 [Acrodontium crateriforme]
MPGRIFGIDLRRASPQPDQPLRNKNNSISSLIPDSRRSSMEHLKRPTLSLAKRLPSHDRKDRSLSKDKHAKDAPRSPLVPAPIKLNMLMESPPALFIDPPNQSTGALISGRLQVTCNLPEVTLTSIIMYLEATTTIKRPVHERCRECATTINDLYEWKFFSKPKHFTASEGMQELPFSHLIPGHLPSTTHGQLGTIEYSLHVRAMSSDGRETEFRRDLPIHRALRPGNDKNSVRIFPPTNLALHVTLPNIIHQIGEFPVQCRMTGIASKREDTQTRWRLRKLTWRIEESEEMISPACSKHANKVGGEGKGVKHESKREIGHDELKQGWKTDFDQGQVEGEFMASIDSSTNPQCSVEAQNGLKISHNIVLELVIAEEWAPNKKPHQATPTGAARVLRTQFNLNVAARSGMGIAWDDEQPPMYDDVPASPPHYQNNLTELADYSGEDLHADVEHLTLGDE